MLTQCEQEVALKDLGHCSKQQKMYIERFYRLSSGVDTFIFNFKLFWCVSLQPQGCLHMLKKDVFVQLVNLLLGPSSSRWRSCHDDGALTRCSSSGPSTRPSLTSSAAQTSPYLSLRLTPTIQFLLIRTWCLPRG